MAGFLKPSQPEELLRVTTRQKAIEAGLDYLHGAGADHICSVCIPNGGSCCIGCDFLNNGVGCQRRNTSCTAWLCGFQKFIFYEAGLITEWESFWEQVPGQLFREDATPPTFGVTSLLQPPKIRFLSEAFAEDLKELIPLNHSLWILEIKAMVDRYVDMLTQYQDPEIKRKIEKKLHYATKDFRHFNLAVKQL
ncbi:hypothetical protein [Paenibacillus sp. MBLB4367]|uniref:hypothetical protein n=1 Tax=Paenibacillus sp. MBLB4367 TaxID=3384767 RepID=UPI0039081F22